MMRQKMLITKIGGCSLLAIAQACCLATMASAVSMRCFLLVIREEAMVIIRTEEMTAYMWPKLTMLWTWPTIKKVGAAAEILNILALISLCILLGPDSQKQSAEDDAADKQTIWLGLGLWATVLLIGYVTQFREPQIVIVAGLLLVILVAACLLRRVCRYGTIAP